MKVQCSLACAAQRGWASALIVTLVAACGAGPIAPSERGVPEVGVESEPVPEAPEPVEPPRVWAPSEPRRTAPGELAWSRVEVQSACPDSMQRVNKAKRVELVASATDFEARFCRKPKLDWARYRLVVAYVEGEVRSVDVVRDSERINVMLTTQQTCDSGWGTEVRLLLEDTSLPVAVAPKALPPTTCPEGHAY